MIDFGTKKVLCPPKLPTFAMVQNIPIMPTSPKCSAAMPNTPAATCYGDRATSTPLQSLATTTATTATVTTKPSTVAVAVSDITTTPNSLPCCDWAIF